MALNKPILTKPAGESTLGSYGSCGNWNNERHGTDGPVTCEICGTDHPGEGGAGYIVSTFLGLQVVEECCGRVLDVVYSESGEEFCQRYLEEFADNPADPRYYVFRKILSKLVAKAMENLQKAAEDLQTVQIPSALDPPEGRATSDRRGRLLLQEEMKGGGG